MTTTLQQPTARVGIYMELGRNQQLLSELLSAYEIVEIDETVPDETDLCIVDLGGFEAVEDALLAWKERERPAYAPVIALVDAEMGSDPWTQYADVLGETADTIQVIPAPKAAIQARVETHLETRQYSRELDSERRLVERLFETSPVAHTLVDPTGHIVRANERSETVLGLSESALTDRSYDALEWGMFDANGESIPSEDLPFSRVMASGEPVYGYEHGIEHPDGSEVWLSITMAPLRDESGEIEYLLSAIEDITTERALEQQLRESEQLHRVTLENIIDTVLIADDAGDLTYVCPNVHHLFGYSAEDVREMGTVQALLGEDLAPARVSDSKVVENIDTVILDSEGRERDVLVTVKPVSIQTGTRLYSIRDVTDLVRTRAELHQQRERLETILAHAPLVLFSVDADGTVGVARGDQLERFGLAPDQIVGQSIYEVMDNRPQFRANVKRMLAGEVFSAQVPFDDQTFQTWYQPIYTDGNVDHGVVVAQDITERKAHKAELERQFDLFAKAQDLADVGAWEYDLQTNKGWWTDSVAELHGLDPEVTPSVTLSLEYYHPEDRPIIEDAFERAVSEGEPYDLELRLIDDSGIQRWVRTRGQPQFAEDGTLLRVRGTLQDITDRKERMEQLREYMQAVESSTDLLTAVDAQYNVVFANAVYRSFHGLGQQELRGKPLVDVVGEDEFAAIKPRVEAALNGQIVQYETTRTHPTKGERTLDVQYYPLRDEDGEAYGMVGALRDITQRKAMEVDLRENKERYESLFNSIRDAIIVTDTDHEVVNCNTAFTDLFGYELDDIEGASMSQIYDSQDSFDGLTENIDAHIDDPQFVQTVDYQTSGGVTFPGETNVSYIRDSDGTVTGFISIIRDVSRREEQLQQLRAMDRVLQHNYHNEMQVIQANAQLIEESTDGELAEQAAKIIETSDELIGRVDHDRKIRKFLADQPDLRSVDICALTDLVVEAARDQYPSATITVDAPPTATVIGTTKLDQAITELVQNAIEHAGHDDPTVDVQILTVGETVQLSVSDDGPGIPEMERAVVTGEKEIEPVYHGSGLGLWFVRLIVKHCYGGLDFTENEGGGSTVTMTLSAVR